MATAEISILLESLELNRKPVRFEHAIAIIPSQKADRRWAIVVLDADSADLCGIAGKVELCAASLRGERLAGTATFEAITPECTYVRLRGSGPLLRG